MTIRTNAPPPGRAWNVSDARSPCTVIKRARVAARPSPCPSWRGASAGARVPSFSTVISTPFQFQHFTQLFGRKLAQQFMHIITAVGHHR
jgi:hypothetical protein